MNSPGRGLHRKRSSYHLRSPSHSEPTWRSTSVQFSTVDFYSGVYNRVSKQGNRFVRYIKGERRALLLFIPLLGILSALSAVMMDSIISFSYSVRKELVSGSLFSLIAAVCISLLFAFISATCVHFGTFAVIGSGVPEIKSILGGIHMPEYLTVKTLIAKYVGLTSAFVAGLLAGKEGAYVHVASGIAELLLRIPIFERIRRNEFLRVQVFTVAAAAGVSAIFGAPIGGVLYSIEVTSTYYVVTNLWKGLYAALCGSLLFYVIAGGGELLVVPTQFPEQPFYGRELLIFTALAIVAGLLGALFVHITTFLLRLRWVWPPLRQSLYSIVLLITFATCVVMIGLPFLRGKSPHDLLALFFSTESLHDKDCLWSHPSAYYNLLLFLVLGFLLVVTTIILPIPVGLFAPVFLLGAALGRLAGEISPLLLPYDVIPAVYAVVGAASFASGVTRTLSPSIIAFEITGQIHLLLPGLIGTVVAVAVGNIFNMSVYDEILTMKGLPHLGEVEFGNSIQKKRAMDIMIPLRDLHYFTLDSKLNEVEHVLEVFEQHYSYPVVFSDDDMTLVGVVQRADLQTALNAYKKEYLEAEKHDAQEIEGTVPLVSDEEVHVEDEEITVPPRNIVFAAYTIDQEEGQFVPRKDKGLDKELESENVQPVVFGSDGIALTGLSPSSKRASRTRVLEAVTPHENLVRYKNDAVLENHKESSFIEIDLAPFQIAERTHIHRLHFMFSTIGLSHAFVASGGKLIGVVTKRSMIEDAEE